MQQRFQIAQLPSINSNQFGEKLSSSRCVGCAEDTLVNVIPDKLKQEKAIAGWFATAFQKGGRGTQPKESIAASPK
jgi:hypothetical protein